MNTGLLGNGGFYDWLWRASWQAAVLAGLVLLAQWLFRKHLTPAWRYRLWLVVVLRLVLPVPPASFISIFNLAHVRSSSPVTFNSRPPAASSPTLIAPAIAPQEPARPAPATMLSPASQSITRTVKPSPPPQATPSLWTRVPAVLPWLWALGVAWLAGRTAWQNLRFGRRLRAEATPVPAEVERQFAACRERLDVRQPVTLLETSSVRSPALYGFFQAQLLLPRGLTERFSAEEMRYMLLHELAHLKRRDLAMNWLLALLQALHWFNPALWLAFARLRVDRELACDALALSCAREEEATRYGETIIRLLEGMSRTAAMPGMVGVLESREQIRERIRMIAAFKRPSRWSALAALLLVGLGVVGLTDAKDGKKPLPPVQPISLTNLLTAAENDCWLKEPVWQAVPRGTQDLGGIEFHLEGLIQLFGQGPQGDGHAYREKIILPLIETNTVGKNTEVIRRGTNIGSVHLLSGTGYDADAGARIAEVIWRYTDDTFKRTPIQYGVHVRDWWRLRYEEPAHLPYEFSKVVWRGTHPDVTKWGKTLRLYRIIFANPEPKKTVRQLEFLSAKARPAVFIAAVTLDPLKPGEGPDNTPDLEEADPPLTGHLKLIVQDAEGHPIAGAAVETHFEGTNSLERATFQKSFTTDKTGVADVRRPGEGLTRLEVTASKDGYASRRIIWNTKVGDTIPASYTVKLRGGVTVGGLVVDPDGNPVPEAAVELHRVGFGGEAIERDKGETATFSSQKQTTDREGHWTARNLPVEFVDHILIVVSHPDFIGTNVIVGQDKQVEKALREGTYKIALARGLEARGLVTDDQDHPIADATVWVGLHNFGDRHQVKTGPDGRFVFHNVKEGNCLFSVLAKSRKAASKSVKVKPEMEDIVFRLDPGNVIRARVQNEAGDGLSGARVALDGNGNMDQAVEFSTTTDGDGRFQWDSAPDEPQQFYFYVSGYEEKRNTALKPNEDNVVTMRRSRHVDGRVVDADTDKPITRFYVGVGQSFGDSSRLLNARPQEFSDPNGAFTLNLDEEDYNGLEAGADDYADVIQPLPKAKDGVVTVVLRLKPSSALKGIVVTPDGQPVPGTTVFIPTDGNPGFVQLTHGRFISRGLAAKLTTTDASGQFQIASPPENGTVLAAGEIGFAAVPLAQARASGTLVLQPYGRIEGVLRIGSEPGAGQDFWPSPAAYSGLQLDFATYKTTTDADGHFVIEQIPPGKVNLTRMVQTMPNSWMRSHSTEVVVEPGKTTQITLGDTGAVLRGHVSFETPPPADSGWVIGGQLNTPPVQVNLPSGLSADQARAYIVPGRKRAFI
jgi:beta-lactamase regulating signal transducer with metallopeptidase domain